MFKNDCLLPGEQHQRLHQVLLTEHWELQLPGDHYSPSPLSNLLASVPKRLF